jgi:hypothetical protein
VGARKFAAMLVRKGLAHVDDGNINRQLDAESKLLHDLNDELKMHEHMCNEVRLKFKWLKMGACCRRMLSPLILWRCRFIYR